MKSMYDNIKTAALLIDEVKRNGLSMKDEDICRAQDILGHSNAEELAEIANDIKTQDIFYWTLFKVWNWKEAVSFWNEHTNAQTSEYIMAKSAIKSLEAENKELQRQRDKTGDTLREEVKLWSEQRARAAWAEAELEKKEQEILRLKARLFDMIESKTA